MAYKYPTALTSEDLEGDTLTLEQISESQGNWHGSKSEGYLKACGMITGCGILQVRGVSSYKDSKSLKKDIMKIFETTDVGMILCTLGDMYFNRKYFPNIDYEKIILDAGFEMIQEYANLRHGAGSRQRLYSYSIEDPRIEKKE